MSLADVLAPHLSSLRRYARALAGSRTAGDARVAGLLEMILADPSCFPAGLGPRVGLYRLFVASQPRRPAAVAADPGLPEWEARARARLAALDPYPRQAFLLVAMEGFDAADAARILDVDTHVLGHLLGVAGHELAEQLRTEVLIIEDEPIIALELETLVTALGHTVTGVARSRAEAVDLARAWPPGLVLSDIQLIDGSSGVDAVADLRAERAIPAVFVTAFPDRFLTGEGPEPTFLVTKPFRPEQVEAVISQALFFGPDAPPRMATGALM